MNDDILQQLLSQIAAQYAAEGPVQTMQDRINAKLAEDTEPAMPESELAVVAEAILKLTDGDAKALNGLAESILSPDVDERYLMHVGHTLGYFEAKGLPTDDLNLYNLLRAIKTLI